MANEPELTGQNLSTSALPDLYAALTVAKRELWNFSMARWNLSDFKNFAVVQQIDAALSKADGKDRS